MPTDLQPLQKLYSVGRAAVVANVGTLTRPLNKAEFLAGTGLPCNRLQHQRQQRDAGRWHTRGPLQVAYTGARRALCQLKKRLRSNGAHPKNQTLIRLDLPDGAAVLDARRLGLPADWLNDHQSVLAVTTQSRRPLRRPAWRLKQVAAQAARGTDWPQSAQEARAGR